MTAGEAKNCLREWQNRLRLSDWTITINPQCTPSEIPAQDVDGYTEWSESIKTACIYILDPFYYGKRIRAYDFERILVHELLHLKFSLLDDGENSLQTRYVHQVIDDLAVALADAKEH